MLETKVKNDANNAKNYETVNDKNFSHSQENERSQYVEETNRKNKDSAEEILVKVRKLKRKTTGCPIKNVP